MASCIRRRRGAGIRTGRRRWSLAVTALAVAGSMVLAPASPAKSRAAAAVKGPWIAHNRDPAWRAQKLVAAMTLDEKLAMVHGIGLPLTGAGAGSVPGNERLGIPALALSDGPLGVGNGATGVTQWPSATNQASTWDTELIGQWGEAMGREFRGKGRNVLLAPTVNIVRVPLWGRAFETFSEDPFLTSQLAVAEIRGIQSQHVIATVKHFAANNQETLRGSIDVQVGERTQQEIYFPAFEAAVKDADVAAVMCSYNRLNGDYACENAALLSTALRDMWNFAGFVVSDWGATHSTAQAANAGLDVEMPSGQFFGDALKAAVQSGEVPASRLDAMVRHVLTGMFQVGLFDHPVPDSATRVDTVVSTPAHQRLAERLSEQGSVLLKNEGGVLPLANDEDKTIAVIGNAGDAGASYHGGGSAVVEPSHAPISPLTGITERTASNVVYAKGPGGQLPVLAADRVTPAGGSGTGFTGTYYSTPDFTGDPLAVRNDPTIDFGTGQLGEYSLPVPHAKSVRWEGTLDVPTTGTYRFSMDITGVGRLFVNGQKLIDVNANERSVLGEGTIELTAGQPAHIVIENVPFYLNFGSFEVHFSHIRLGAQTPDDGDPIAQAAQTAKDADVAVVFASDFTAESSDRTSLALPGEQDTLIDAVADANPNTVVVLNTGSAVTMPWLNKVRSVLEVWYPGQEYGNALASLLFGDVSPSGKLPLTFPASDQQGPWAAGTDQFPGNGTTVQYSEGNLVGYRWYDTKHEQPLFAFGHGLSYTTFAYGRLNTADLNRGARSTRVRVLVKNTGKRAGAEVVQAYVGKLPTAIETEPQQLAGFGNVYLKPGQQQYVTIRIDRRDLSYWDSGADRWVTPTGDVPIRIGASSRDIRLTGHLTVR
jgi:beta-glucosidase